ncbi:MAG: fused MFS/spermidine synthase [Planctomycetota bacterium]
MQLIFAATILLSAALMFIVEPMFAKMVLRLLGGSPSVWNTCLVFYQAVLMAGYIYAHLSLKWLGPRRQPVLHIALLCMAWICLPISVAQGWTPPGESNPAPWLLLLLTVCVGLPFFCISASAPVLQAWFAHCGGRSAKDPYFLYAASNLGSLAGLAAYPLLIEPRLPLALQTQWWTAGYGLFMAFFGLCAAALWIAGRRPTAVTEPATRSAAEDSDPSQKEDLLPAGFHAPITLLRRLHWLALALVPSALLMGVTAHLSVDIASMPLLWAIPLGLYLLSFILVFARWPILKWLWLLRIFQAAGLAGSAATIYVGGLQTFGIVSVGMLHLAAFFLTALVCHGAMAADRPASKHLTEFYLWMSAGGVVGGLLCALVAPLIFNSVLEYPLMLVAACLLRPLPRSRRYDWFWRPCDLLLMLVQGCVFAFAVCALSHGRLADMAATWSSGSLKTFALAITNPTAQICWVVLAGVLAFLLQRRRVRFATSIATLLVICAISGDQERVLYSARSFFGVLRVQIDHYDRDGEQIDSHTLMHGSTMHGQQSRDPEDSLEPWTYYYRTGPVGEVFDALKERVPFLRGHIGVVGLGTGTVAAYAQPGQRLTYFEIDAVVRRIAENPDYFTYLSRSRVRPQIRMGDARLTLAREPNGQFDVLLIDAFSSDAIPVHLITYEAVKMYFQKLAPHGLLMVHVSNRHLRLEPVLAGTAKKLGVVARLREDDDETGNGKTSSTWAVLARMPEDLGQLNDNEDWQPLEPEEGVALWTDDYSSIVSVMNWNWLPKWMRRADADE